MLPTPIRSRVEPALKKEAVDILNACGLDLSTAIRLFLHRVVATNGLPFEVAPNEETIAAMQEARKLSARFGSRQSAGRGRQLHDVVENDAAPAPALHASMRKVSGPTIWRAECGIMSPSKSARPCPASCRN